MFDGTAYSQACTRTHITQCESFKMSADEDTELRDLVAQTLEANGVLGKIRVGTDSVYTIDFVGAQ